ncbi:MAG TPA: ATP-binding cassette domain-containing protein, partial [Stellaceae bacterium]|nr:ATP-binding cassette domain-containing protein [Stellaceae bacterium]
MAGEALLRVEKLNASYGLAQILFDLDLEVAPGEVLALLGRNGAGKSTTLKSIIGLLPPRSGAIQFAGERIDGRPAHVIARLGVGYVPEDRRI